MSDKKPLVLFSSGLDSSFLMWQHTKSEQPVYYMYADGGQGDSKKRVERASRELVLKELRKLHSNIYHRERQGHVVTHLGNGKSMAWRQALPWMVAAIEIVDPDEHSCVQIGYNMDDDILQEKQAMLDAWAAMWKFTKLAEFVPLQFPLQYVSKIEMLKHMPPDVYTATWVCELPELNDRTGATACGRCRACETRKVEEYRFSLRFGKTLAEHHEVMRAEEKDAAERKVQRELREVQFREEQATADFREDGRVDGRNEPPGDGGIVVSLPNQGVSVNGVEVKSETQLLGEIIDTARRMSGDVTASAVDLVQEV